MARNSDDYRFKFYSQTYEIEVEILTKNKKIYGTSVASPMPFWQRWDWKGVFQRRVQNDESAEYFVW